MKLTVTSSPHIRNKVNTGNIMRDVIIALLPAFVIGAVYNGPRAIMVTLVCMLTCVLAEFLWSKLVN